MTLRRACAKGNTPCVSAKCRSERARNTQKRGRIHTYVLLLLCIHPEHSTWLRQIPPPTPRGWAPHFQIVLPLHVSQTPWAALTLAMTQGQTNTQVTFCCSRKNGRQAVSLSFQKAFKSAFDFKTRKTWVIRSFAPTYCLSRTCHRGRHIPSISNIRQDRPVSIAHCIKDPDPPHMEIAKAPKTK